MGRVELHWELVEGEIGWEWIGCQKSRQNGDAPVDVWCEHCVGAHRVED